jgi:hypothetical protein
MKARCYNEKHDAYPYYGGRGVRVCEEWLNNPKAFIDWAIANGWQRGLDIDKDIKAKKIGMDAIVYSPDICQFVTKKENGSAKRDNRLITYKGKIQTLNKWSEELGIKRETISKRLDTLGYTIEKAFSKKDQRTLVKHRNFKAPRSGKDSPVAKKIKQVDVATGEVVNEFDAVILAERETGIKNSSISSALKGRYKTAGGYKWEYA